MGNNRTGRIVCGRESAQGPRYGADVEGGCNAHNRAEQQHGLHAGQRDMIQLLPAVPDTVHISGFIHAAVNALEAGHKAQEAGTHAHPQGYDDNNGQHVPRIGQPQNRRVDHTVLHQEGVEPSVGVATENRVEHFEGSTADRGDVEYDNRHRPQPFRQFIDKPGKQEGKDISNRPNNDGANESVLDRCQEYFILQEQVRIVLQSDKTGRFQDVVVSKTVNDRCADRQNEEGNKQNRVWSQEQVAALVPFCKRPPVCDFVPPHSQVSMSK